MKAVAQGVQHPGTRFGSLLGRQVDLDALAKAKRFREVIIALDAAGFETVDDLIEAAEALAKHPTIECALIRRIADIPTRVRAATDLVDSGTGKKRLTNAQKIVQMAEAIEFEEQVEELRRNGSWSIFVTGLTHDQMQKITDHVWREYDHLGVRITTVPPSEAEKKAFGMPTSTQQASTEPPKTGEQLRIDANMPCTCTHGYNDHAISNEGSGCTVRGCTCYEYVEG